MSFAVAFSLIFLILVVILLTIRLVSLSNKLNYAYEKNNELTSQITNLQDNLRSCSSSQSSLNSKLSLCYSIINSMNTTNSQLKKELNITLTKLIILNSSYSQLYASYDNQSKYIDKLKLSISKIENRINYFYSRLNSTAEWFRNNSVYSNYLLSSCYSENTVNLPCIALYVNKHDLKINYFSNSLTHYFQSINQFIKYKGGDCKGFSLFFKAELNSILNHVKDPKFIAFIPNNDYGSKVWLTRTWYLPYASKFVFSNYRYPFVVCGLFNPKLKVGHCVIALSKYNITNVSELNGSVLIEPQTGQYLGVLGKNVSLLPTNNSRYVFLVISNNDVFQYDLSSGKWESLNYFFTELYNFDSILKLALKNKLNSQVISYLISH